MLIAGLDEVGRGCLAGPLVTAAVILPRGVRLKGLNDSKQISAGRREELSELITKKCDFGIGLVSPKLIDDIGIIRANNLAFLIAINNLKQTPQKLLVDGNDRLILPYPHETIIKGDSKIRCIMAASIVAKVARDRMMAGKYEGMLPEYGFRRHKGYGTLEHRNNIEKHGMSAIHRRRFCRAFAF
ncbi:ribonuclease HII [Patescibacteria group bacterium]|nr:ribonuclease HII [Patescibacteria group bacterium]